MAGINNLPQQSSGSTRYVYEGHTLPASVYDQTEYGYISPQQWDPYHQPLNYQEMQVRFFQYSQYQKSISRKYWPAHCPRVINRHANKQRISRIDSRG
jgi:hypothetical protein